MLLCFGVPLLWDCLRGTEVNCGCWRLRGVACVVRV